MALALDLVDRLEEFSKDAIEHAGPQTVIQYRDEILPLVDVDKLLTERRRRSRKLRSAPDTSGDAPDERYADDATIQVVVHRHRDRRIGVVVTGSSTSSSLGWNCSRPAARVSRGPWSSTTG